MSVLFWRLVAILRRRDSGDDPSALDRRSCLNAALAAQHPHAFPYAVETDAARRANSSPADPYPVVENGQRDPIHRADHRHVHFRRSAVLHDVVESLLSHTKYREHRLVRQTVGNVRVMALDLDA